MAKTKKGAIPEDAGEQVLERLRAKARPKRTKRTLVLTEDTYEEFEKLCRDEERYPSEVIDEFIQLFIEGRRGKR